MQFATNYFYTGTRFLVKAGTKVDKLSDLAGKTVVSTTGTTNYQSIRRLNEEQKLGIDLLGAKDHPESMLMVQTGRAVAFAMDDILIYSLKASAQNPALFRRGRRADPGRAVRDHAAGRTTRPSRSWSTTRSPG